ncbi:MAG TPA: hypothetical protein VNT53_09705 [Pseudolysinimonas sp.]|nr:hypothetical protein [Pseudolysinimonas sp.]
MSTRFAIVGMGFQGAGIAKIALSRGHELVGAVDIGPKVGKPVSEFVDGAVPSAIVHGSVADLVNLPEPPHFVLSAATIDDPEVELDLARPLLAAGIGYLTINPAVFELTPEQHAEIDALGRANNAGYGAVGMQDIWWVQLPTLAAAAISRLDEMRYHSRIDIDTLVGLEQFLRMGEAPLAEGEPHPMQDWPSVMGDPMLTAARRMNLTPGEMTTYHEEVLAEKDLYWERGDLHVKVGHVVGSRSTNTFETAEGVSWRGVVEAVILQEGQTSRDEYQIIGEPSVTVTLDPYPGNRLTNAAAVSRIPDVLEGAGVLDPETLPAPRFAPTVRFRESL